MKNKTTIKSIRYPLTIDKGLLKLGEEKNYENHVRQLIKQVLFTNYGERINRPDFGCGINRMVFAPNGTASASLAQVTILQALEKWLGVLIKVQEVNVRSNDTKMEITIRYFLKAMGKSSILNLEI